MAVTAADVPGKYDVVFVGVPGVSDFGCVYADSVEPSLPFRTHRAIYDRTPTFIERQNISGSWGDDQQAFFMTQSQNDWSLGAGQKYFNDPTDVTQKRKFWSCLRAEVTTAGEISLGASAKQSALIPSPPICATPGASVSPGKHVVFSATNPYTVDAAGGVTVGGGVGTPVKEWGAFTDGSTIKAAGTATISGSNTYLNGFVYTCDGSLLDSFVGGVTAIVYTWKDSTGTALTANARTPKLIPFGGKVLIWWPRLFDRPELWQYDGSATNVQATLPSSVIGHDAMEIDGLVYLSGLASATQGGVSGGRPTIWLWDGSSLAKVYESAYIIAANAVNIAAMPALGSYHGDLVFTDAAQANGPYATPMLMRYVLATGAIYPLDSYSVSSLTGVFTPFMSSADTSVLLCHKDAGTNQVLYPFDYSGAAQLDTSLFTFDSSLTKLLRGVTIDWTGNTAPNVSFQVDSVDGSYTALATGVASGVETAFPAGTTGRGVSIRVTIPSGTTKIKRIMVRAAPELTSFKRGVYILDCTGTTDKPRQLRDGTPAPITGYEVVQNLLAAATSKTPFTVTDKINGTYTGLIDLQDPEGWDVYEVHPYPDDKARPGCYLVRATVREV